MHNRIKVNTHLWRGSCALLGCLLVMAAATARAQAPIDPALVAIPVGSVNLQVERSATEQDMLDVGLAIFNPGIPLDEASHSMLGIFPEIRKAESQFMPVLLRQVLLASGAWGVVRVLPDEQIISELLVTGKIRHSDGSRLE